MRFEDVETLRRHSPAWKLLRADHAPLIRSFCHRIFVEENARSVAGSELASRLDDELYALRERLGPEAYPKPAKAYLDDWSTTEAGWLRKYYPAGSDEPHFDATPAVEKALSWVYTLRTRSSVGTEGDPEVRLAELRGRRHGPGAPGRLP